MTDIYALNVGKPSPVKPPVGETPIEKQPWIPSFEAAFAIAGLLTVAYLLRRR
ncbi:MAG: PGF-CTERM sorting domain-containing protein [Methanophagales archaeon]|nr:PGF-CTERM sorting domain-containing protein [Methanophagales archaeon]